MLCKDCPHFHIDYPPLKDIDYGRASCDKYDLITNFIDMRKFETLRCVDDEENKMGIVVEIGSLGEMCDLMCDNVIPEREKEDDTIRDWSVDRSSSADGGGCADP